MFFAFCREWNLNILEYAKSMAFLIFGSNFLIDRFISLWVGFIILLLLKFFSYLIKALSLFFLISLIILGTIDVSTAFPDLLLSKKKI